jgi:hypothetical protein
VEQSANELRGQAGLAHPEGAEHADFLLNHAAWPV